MSTLEAPPSTPAELAKAQAKAKTRAAFAKRRPRSAVSLFAQGEPMIWLVGGMLALAVAMIVGLLALILYHGMATFWPAPVVVINTIDGKHYMGEVSASDVYTPESEVIDELPSERRMAVRDKLKADQGLATRQLLRTGNFELTNTHYTWVSGFMIESRESPEWAIVIERLTWGRFYGVPKAFIWDGTKVASDPAAVWQKYQEVHDIVRAAWEERRELETHEIGAINDRIERARLAARAVELRGGTGSAEHVRLSKLAEDIAADGERKIATIRKRIDEINAENNRYQLVMASASGHEKTIQVADIVRAYPANQIGFAGKLGVYLSRWDEFLTDDPREANSEGGVYPAIFGTVAMTLMMCLLVVPFGVLAALYLREYAKAGPVVSAVRIAVNNLAGVPSIVFGIFGLGFFCYIVGAGIDQIFFEARLPNPTFGKGALVWASFTLALMTLPVVIVATEEALAAVPNSMREGSYACGASKWQTILRIVLPRAMPGIMTGMILAMARGAGEVAPLMLVGAVKLAPELPVDGAFPFVHLQRSFMHLGFHIFDLGFQSQNSDAARPMVFTTTLLLILIIFLLNVAAIRIRSALRKKFMTSAF